MIVGYMDFVIVVASLIAVADFIVWVKRLWF